MPPEDILDEAIAWHVRLSAANVPSEEWQAFAAWLARSPEHAAAYDAVAQADEGLEGLAGAGEPGRADARLRPAWRRRWWIPAGALAAAASIMVAILFRPDAAGPAMDLVETPPGAKRVVVLEQGDRIELNGGTRLAVDRGNPRFARLDRGEAAFFVRHDPERPFTVAVGGYTLVDRGTVFGIALTASSLSVGVAEGEVSFERAGRAVVLAAGRSLRLTRGEGRIALGRIEPAAVTDWIQGRLIYRDEPLATIAADLSRSTGRIVEVSPEIATRRFTGVIILRGDEAALFEDVGGLLGVTARRSRRGWLLTP